ncbi:hypothetical protein [Eggerthella sinensis]|uniref:hypothetical protein n=1 Tax=Eggerthella sinensis TaxID=242230 RepID=UPI0022DF1727|nr:hypothetical protein [Eggerthella sinensis]
MDWSSSGRIDSFRYVRVHRGEQGWEEVEELTGITGGTLERNDLTAIKVSGSLTYIDEPRIGRDLLRVYSDSLDPQTGERVSIAHGTYLVSTPSSTYRGAIEEGTADLYGVLQLLAEDAFEAPFALPAGRDALLAARAIVEEAGLNVIATPASAKLSSPAVFDDESASKLDVVNWLMSFAGFETATCDGFGNVLLRPYVNPADRAPSFSMRDDDSCVYRSGVVRECDTFSVPNVVTVTCSNASKEQPLTATAVNDDPSSAFSTVTRQRRIVYKESMSDIESESALKLKAEALLAAKTSVAESFEITHAFLPMNMGEVCDFVYDQAGIRRNDLAATRQTMSLRPGMECTTQFQRCTRR